MSLGICSEIPTRGLVAFSVTLAEKCDSRTPPLKVSHEVSFKFIFKPDFLQTPVGGLSIRKIRRIIAGRGAPSRARDLAVHHSEQLIVMLPEAVIPATHRVPGYRPAERYLPPCVVGSPIIRGVRRQVDRISGVVGAIVMIKRRHRQERIGAEGSHPGEVHKCVGLVFAITLENASWEWSRTMMAARME